MISHSSAAVLVVPRTARTVRLRSPRLVLPVIAVAVMFSIALAFGFSDARARVRCESISAQPYGQDHRAKIRVAVYKGPVSCRSARRVIRYTIEHKASASGLASPRGWRCARGAPSQTFTATGVSCETRRRPLRIVEGLFPRS